MHGGPDGPAAFCGQCGACTCVPVPEHVWMIPVPMISNRFMLYDPGKLLRWTGFVIARLMLVCFDNRCRTGFTAGPGGAGWASGFA